jgi:hypothetical protein
MTVVGDFTQILGDTPITIGDGNPVWQQNFDTTGREVNSPGFLIFNVGHLTHTDLDVVVSVNGNQVGVIYNYRPGGAGIDTININQPEKLRQAPHYYTQIIAFSGDQINNGNNTIQIQAVGFPESTAANTFDDFTIKDVFCFFHQNV